MSCAASRIAAACGLPLWINRYGYLSDAKLDALAAMRGRVAARGNAHVSSGNG